MTTATTTQIATKATKATKITLEQVKQLVEVRAEIARLEKLKVSLTAEIEGVFGVDKVAKTAEFDTLTHNGIEFARIDLRVRKGVDTEKLATEFPEAYEACFDPEFTKYFQIVSLYK
jgi:predicted phage-related endonuclease